MPCVLHFLILSLFSFSTIAHVGLNDELILTNKRLKTDPENKDLLLKRSVLFRQLNYHKNSLNELNKLISQYPLDSQLYFQRALTYKELQALEKAELDLTRAIEFGGTGWKIYAERAKIREGLKAYMAALEDYSVCLNLTKDEEFYYRCSQLASLLERPDEEKSAFLRNGL